MTKQNNKEGFEEALVDLDWERMARAFREEDVQWHAKEWKAFVQEIRNNTLQEVEGWAENKLVNVELAEHLPEEVLTDLLSKLKEMRAVDSE